MKAIYLILISFLYLNVHYYAQATTIKLPTTDNSSSFNITNSSNTVMLKINADAGFYLGGIHGSGVIPIEGAGTRLMWYPRKSAFRAGYISSTMWDDSTIGTYSTATGRDTKANGSSSTAMGFNTTASGNNSFAMGYFTKATGYSSTSMGVTTTASGSGSTAMGQYNTASGNYSTVMGYSSDATGTCSFASGFVAHADGFHSIAIGDNALATGDNSAALGKAVSTNSHEGSFIIGDNSGSIINNSSAANQMTMRFDGGYRFFTSSSFSTSQCAFLNSDANSWSTTSDSTKKENFIKADEEYFLNSISKLRLGSWNYENQNPKEYRHYGPMAQEIFHYFGKDNIGIIGNDTTLSSSDMDGILMICLQALESRTSGLKESEDRIKDLEREITELNAVINDLKREYKKLSELENSIKEMKDVISSLFDKNSITENYVTKK